MYLIVGGDGLIGKNLSEYWIKQDVSFHSSTRKKELVSECRPFIDLKELDLEGLTFTYSAIVFCAGISNINECEKNPIKTRNINVVSSFNLIQKLSNSGSFIVFLSSNQVFDGRTNLQKVNDEKSPITQYGGQKSEMEDLVSKLEGYSILRLTKVIHPEFSLFKEWDSKLMKNIEIKAFTDMVFCPVDIDTVISKIDGLLTNKVNGIYHCSGDVDITYYKYAENLGLSVQLDCKEECLNNIDIFTPPRFTCLC